MMGIATRVRRLLYLLRCSRHDADLREEMETHRSLRQETLEREGVAPGDAAAASRRALGNVTLAREDARQVWIAPALESLRQDARGGFRMLRSQPVLAATVIVTLALGIGASTAIFSIVDAVLLRPLPYDAPDRLVRIWESNPVEGNMRSPVSVAAFNDWRTRSRAFDDLALFSVPGDPTVIGVGEESLQARQSVVTPNLFVLLGVRPGVGRVFGDVPERRGPLEDTEVVLSHELWQRVFDGRPDAVGQRIRIEGADVGVVVGVMPPAFVFPAGTDFWTPTAAPAGGRRDWRESDVIGRLAAGQSVDSAERDLKAIASALASEHPDTNGEWTVAVASLHESIVGDHRVALTTLSVAVAFVVLVGCANVANLLLTRGMARRGELAVRVALGASRSRVVRLLLAETTVLAAAGGAAGWAVAAGLLPLMAHLAGSHVPRLGDAGLNATALAYAATATVFAAVVAGVMPAIRLSRADPQRDLRSDGGRTTRASAEIRVQRVIVTAELAACLVLLVGAMLFSRTLTRMTSVDLGFDPQHVVSIETRVPIYRSLAPDRWQRLASDATTAMHRVRAIPGVQAAATTSDLPLDGNLLTADISLPDDPRSRQALYHRVSPGYFRTMGMTLLQGRDFTDDDISDLARLSAMPDPRSVVPRPGVVIVNEAAARAFWPSGNAVGQAISTQFDARGIGGREVVGIVRDVRSDTLTGAPPVEVYVPYLEDPGFVMTLLVRTSLPADRIVPVIRRELRRVSPDLSTANIRMLEDVVAGSTRSSRFSAVLVGAFATVALALSAVGIFGVFAFDMATRARDVGIRIALGATSADIVRAFLGKAAGPIGVGLAIGTLGALGLGRLVQTLLFGVEPTDAVSFVAAAVLLVAVATGASYLPVRRLLRADPARSLRE